MAINLTPNATKLKTAAMTGLPAGFTGSASDAGVLLKGSSSATVAQRTVQVEATANNGTRASTQFKMGVSERRDFRYWRIAFPGAQGAAGSDGKFLLSVSEISLSDINGTKWVSPSTPATASSSTAGNGPEWTVDGKFGANESTSWISEPGGNVDAWLAYDLGTKQTIRNFLMIAPRNFLTRAPRKLVVQASDDGVTYRDIKAIDDAGTWVRDTWKAWGL